MNKLIKEMYSDLIETYKEMYKDIKELYNKYKQ